MKKILVILIMLILFPIGVLAESSDTITIDFGKIKHEDDITFIQHEALLILENNQVISFEYGNDCSYYKNSSNKRLTKYDFNTYMYSVMPNVTSADNITYTIKDTDRQGYNKLLNGKTKIVVKYDGTYKAKEDCNLYLYDLVKSVNESPHMLITAPEMYNRYGIVDYDDTNYYEGKVSKNNKLLATISFANLTSTIPSNVDENDNITVDINALDGVIDSKIKEAAEKMADTTTCKRINLLFAKPTQNNAVRIMGAELLNKSDGTSIIEVPTYNNLNINSNATFSTKDDYVKYRLVIENKDNIDYKISLDNLNSKYIEYRLETEDGKNIAKANSNTNVILTIKYNGAPESEFVNGFFKENKQLKINVTASKGSIIVNPKTKGILFVVALVIGLMIASVFIIKSKTVRTQLLVVLIIAFLMLPCSVLAIKELTLTVNSNISVAASSIKNRLFIDGNEVNLLEDACASGAGVYYVPPIVYNSGDDTGEITTRIDPENYIDIMIGNYDIQLYGIYQNSKLSIFDIYYNSDKKITMNGQENKPLALMDFIEKYYNEHGLPTEECSPSQQRQIVGIDPSIQYQDE